MGSERRSRRGSGPGGSYAPRRRVGARVAVCALWRTGLQLALRIVGDPELAREVVQDTFLRSWDGRETYDARRGRVPWWLMGIARNRAIDLLRSRSHQARMRERTAPLPEIPTTLPRDPVDAVVSRRAVLDALRELSEGQRRAIELAYYGGLTQTEIANELGEPLGTIKSRTREALERLRKVLGPLIQSAGGRTS
ncbi:MAG: RNA polymerase subunit sigma-70 [Candidatus Rokuibacteriota bacterium]|nr:MAG: RNA polymerase subunit sigma-70 [Candidatus Rokubacteria bacterium]